MSDFGLFASRFRESTSSLTSFDEAVRYFRKADTQKSTAEIKAHLHKLLLVLNPVTSTLEGRLSESMNFDELSVVQILRHRRNRDWQRYSGNLIKLTEKLRAGEVDLCKNDFDVLDDVGDAINMECSSLFRRMSGRA